MTRPDPKLAATARLLENLILLMPEVRDHVNRELANMDSYPTQVPGASVATATTPRECPVCHGDGCDNCSAVEMTRVERAAHRRLQLSADMADIEAGLHLIAITTADVLRNARRVGGIRLVKTTPKICTGGQGREDSIVWGSPTCGNVASRGQLCDACAKRETRHSRSVGLTQRTDSVWSEPGTQPVNSK